MASTLQRESHPTVLTPPRTSAHNHAIPHLPTNMGLQSPIASPSTASPMNLPACFHPVTSLRLTPPTNACTTHNNVTSLHHVSPTTPSYNTPGDTPHDLHGYIVTDPTTDPTQPLLDHISLASSRQKQTNTMTIIHHLKWQCVAPIRNNFTTQCVRSFTPLQINSTAGN